MSKKIVIIQPNVGDETAKYQEEAEKYVKDLGYEILDFSGSTGEIFEIFSNGESGEEFYSAPFVIGATSILMSFAGNVCFSHGWKDVSYCVDLFSIACRYGLNIVLTEPG